MNTLPLTIDGGATGAENMRRDVTLLQRCARGEIAGAIRVYWFDPPCMSVGRMQPMSDVDVDACARAGIDVVRRPSGGRAVLHEHEVTYAVVCRSDDARFGGDVLTSCARIHHAVALGLRMLGVSATPRAAAFDGRSDALETAALADCFARPAAHELLDQHGAKLVGSAQARLGGALLQHGSVLLAASRAAGFLRNAEGMARAAPRPSSQGLRALSGLSLTPQRVAATLAGGFAEVPGVRCLTPHDDVLK